MPTLDELAALDAERRRKLPAAAAIVFDIERDDPDAAARDVRIARELSQTSGYRVPRSLVSQYRTEFQQLSDQERARKILAASPKTAEWWIDADNAALSKDDLERLARIERLAGDGWVAQPTAENVNADPKTRMSTSEVVLGNVKEAGKGLVKGVASDLVGKGMEGTGQLLSGLSHAVSGDAKEKLAALAKRIGQARNASDQELAAIDSDIDLLIGSGDQRYAATSFGQAENAHADFARYVLGRVCAGHMTPDEAGNALAPMFAPSLVETVGSLLQQGGEAVQTRSEEMLKADKGFENSIGRQIGETAGLALGIAGATAVNPALGVSVAVAAGAGSGASDARLTGASESDQTRSALVNGAAGTLNALPFERLLFKPAITGKGLAAIAEWLGKKPVTEGVKNATQQAIKNINAIDSYEPNRSWTSGVWDSFLSGAIVGGAIDLGGGALRTVTGKDATAPTAEQKQAAVNTVLDLSAGSTTRARAPETFESYLKHVGKDGPIENVHLRAETFDAYYRSRGIDPLTIIDMLTGVSRKDFATAMASDGDLRIPTATYGTRIVVDTDADAALRPHLRVDPADTPPAAPEAAPRPQDEASRAAAQEVHDRTIVELSAAGYSPEAAASEALLRSTLYKTMATRSGSTPMALTVPASPEALLQSDIPVLSGDGLMTSTSPLALDGRDKAAPTKVLPETMNDAKERFDPTPQYGPHQPRNHWED